jgi:hypothetical protein
VTWKLGAGLLKLAEGLPTRWRPLYDDYGPARPGLLRRSAVHSAEPPTTSATVRLWKQFARHGQTFYWPSGILLSKLLKVVESTQWRKGAKTQGFRFLSSLTTESAENPKREAVGQTGANTLRVRPVLSQVPLLAFFALFVVGELLFMGSRTRERVAAGVSTVSAALGFQGRAAVGVSPGQTGRIWLNEKCR